MDAFQRLAAENAAIALIQAGNHAGAEARLRGLLAEEPENARALALVSVCRDMAEDRKGALEAARAAAAIDPDDRLVLRTLSGALLREKQFKEAQAIAERLVADDPKDSHALFKLAMARMAQEDFHGANDLLARAEAEAGDSVMAVMNLAHLKVSQWRWDEAEALAKRALALDPTLADVFLVLGECALARKQPEEAYQLALEALRLEPGDKMTLRLLARANARRDALMKPLLPLVDWIVEMDVAGLLLLPLLGAAIAFFLVQSIGMDIARVLTGQQPIAIVSLALLTLLVFGGVAYATAASARLRIRRDLRKLALPRF